VQIQRKVGVRTKQDQRSHIFTNSSYKARFKHEPAADKLDAVKDTLFGKEMNTFVLQEGNPDVWVRVAVEEHLAVFVTNISNSVLEIAGCSNAFSMQKRTATTLLKVCPASSKALSDVKACHVDEMSSNNGSVTGDAAMSVVGKRRFNADEMAKGGAFGAAVSVSDKKPRMDMMRSSSDIFMEEVNSTKVECEKYLLQSQVADWRVLLTKASLSDQLGKLRGKMMKARSAQHTDGLNAMVGLVDAFRSIDFCTSITL
jgi:hypothetical protein